MTTYSPGRCTTLQTFTPASISTLGETMVVFPIRLRTAALLATGPSPPGVGPAPNTCAWTAASTLAASSAGAAYHVFGAPACRKLVLYR